MNRVTYLPGAVTAALREVVETLLLALLIFLSVRALVQNFQVDGFSMEPNLRPGQYLLVNKAVYFSLDGALLNRLLPGDPLPPEQHYLLHPPRRGDVVVFRAPRNPRQDFIKRIVALPGETVEIQEGALLINGAPVAEPYLLYRGQINVPVQKVPLGSYYVLGDNRTNSSDSRSFGPLPRENIVGQAWLVYWPLKTWGWAPNFPLDAVAAAD